VTGTRLVLAALIYYRRTNAAVVLGVATAVAVLGGALLVGDSVRGSLRDLVLNRLGRTDQVVVSSGFFREALAADIAADSAFTASFESVAPLIIVEAVVGDQVTGRRVSRVPVYGVDERFWRFHGISRPGWDRGSDRRDALVSAALADEIGSAAGGAVLVRMARPSEVPLESLHGRKDDLGRTLRLSVQAVVGPAELGEFSLRPQQGRVRAVFVPLHRLQLELELSDRINALLVSTPETPAAARRTEAGLQPALEGIVRRTATLEDLGLTLRLLEPARTISVESAAGLLEAGLASAAERAARETGSEPRSVFTYLANTLRSNNREVPYSLVTAIDPGAMPWPAPSSDPRPPIAINEWAARDLGARAGDPLTLEYMVWEEPGRLVTRSAEFRIASIVPIQGIAADRTLAPVYPGITESDSLAGWDPPFPLDLRRVRKIDEDYWKQYRTTPKAFVPLEVGQRLWRSRYGDRTSIRVTLAAGQSIPDEAARDRFGTRLRSLVDPLAAGLSVTDARGDGLAASRGATDFGEYFTYFSFFLVISALLLAGLFFRLGVEQRAREVGLLRAVGYTTARIRRLFAAEGLLLTAIGSLIGIAGAVAYAAVMIAGLGSWWSGAVGTNALRLHISPSSLAAGAAGVMVTAVACVWWTLRGLARVSERRLLAGMLTADEPGLPGARRSQPALLAAAGFAAVGMALLVASATEAIDKTAAFFGAGNALLVACLCLVAFALRRPARGRLEGRGWWSVSRLGWRHAADRPGRSVLVVAVIAAATFILISVDAFRRPATPPGDRRSGVGGYTAQVELLVPLAHDPNGPDGREALGLTQFQNTRIEPFRVLPGDDASCLNLYQPTTPTILGARAAFIDSGRFVFQSTLDPDGEARANPWLLLNHRFPDQQGPVVPVIADANSMTYVLHKRLGEDIVIDRGGQSIRLRLVAALADSVLQSQLLMSEANFLALFPDQQGYQFLLVEAPTGEAPRIASAIEDGARELGADVVSTTERLADYHRVENTYISTFQTLGGLGLVVGTIGLAAVLLRNVLERRRELALLGAVGYRRPHLFTIVLTENILLLVYGLAIGTLCAVIAVVPAVLDRGGWLPIRAGGWLLLSGVFLAGLLSSIAATYAALRTPLLGSLRAE
jgi:ABC-type lipoprotein release transport system permease subunit